MTAHNEIYTLSLHDALPISSIDLAAYGRSPIIREIFETRTPSHSKHCNRSLSRENRDRKSTRLNSSHRCISYAVFCSKKKISVRYSTVTAKPHIHHGTSSSQ